MIHYNDKFLRYLELELRKLVPYLYPTCTLLVPLAYSFFHFLNYLCAFLFRPALIDPIPKDTKH